MSGSTTISRRAVSSSDRKLNTPMHESFTKFFKSVRSARQLRRLSEQWSLTYNNSTSNHSINTSGRRAMSEPKQVRFGPSRIHPVPPTKDRKGEFWYSKKELDQLYQKDLAELQIQLQRRGSFFLGSSLVVEDGRTTRSNLMQDNEGDNAKKMSSRGLEPYLPANVHRQQQSKRYIMGIVAKDYELRTEHNVPQSYTHTPKGDISKPYQWTQELQWKYPSKRALIARNAKVETVANELADYASQFTWMTRDLALGMARQDESDALQIYAEERHHPGTNATTRQQTAGGNDKCLESSSRIRKPSSSAVSRRSVYAKSA